ncbi:MAG: UvrD-helicase domain-containing protein [Bryobacteraceae bacterium]|nr:UvrD-helicase domain-containing protein [Bryobacteraceae bacterium]
MPLSERQIAAAHRLGQDVCVVAGPGSGKTSVLIERFSWLVRERGVRPENILAITFTEKAATEIRERLLRTFADIPSMREHIERAWVSTIHAFCSRLLRENAIEAAIDPEFQVLEQSWLVLQDVADEVLERRFSASQTRMRTFMRALAVALDRDGFVPDLATSLVMIYDAVRLAGASLSALRIPTSGDFRNHLTTLRQMATDIVNDDTGGRSPKQVEQHREAEAWAELVLSLSEGEITSEHLRAATKKGWHLNHLQANSSAKRHEATLRLLLKEVKCEWAFSYYSDERELIVDLLEEIDSAYRERKRRASLLDFDDLEEKAIELLESDLELRSKTAGLFRYILMDELQDTNPLQWRLLELVRRADNFFAVGDVNQSIYGFRHARPQLFGAYRQALLDSGKHADELRDNYRSRPALLETINTLFTAAPGIEPHSLASGLPFPAKQDPSVEVIAAFGEGAKETEWVEAQWVARRILDLVGTLSLKSRKAEFGDVAILTRANESTGELQRALDRFGIPSVVIGGVTFYDTREIRDLKLVLDVLLNPRDEVALAGLLRSPMFGLGDEELMQRGSAGGLLASVEQNPPAGWEWLMDLRRQRNLMSPDRLLRRVIDASDYESNLTDRARSNIAKYLAMLGERYQRHPAGLAELVASVEQASREAEAPPADGGAAVRLMTLHKAKGLEFPVVFLPFLHKGRNYGTPVISFTQDHGLGVKWRDPGSAENISDAIAKRNEEAARATQDAEENRLLYVGCTRAEEHLVLSWSVTGRNRSCAAGFITSKLGLSLDAATQEAFTQTGVRVFSTDREPTPVAGVAQRARTGNVMVLPVTSMPGSPDSSASVTDISNFAECPRRYFLGRFLNQGRKPRLDLLTASEDDLDERDGGSQSAAELGIEVHALLAGQPAPEASHESVELAARFRTTTIAKKLSRAKIVEHEWDFVFETGGLVLRGQVDLWFECDRQIYLVDYKTDRRPSVGVAGHSLQLRLYALALESALKRLPEKGVLCFLRSDLEEEVDLSPLALNEALEVVYSFQLAQQSGEFTVKPGNACLSCAFHATSCPVGREKAGLL